MPRPPFKAKPLTGILPKPKVGRSRRHQRAFRSHLESADIVGKDRKPALCQRRRQTRLATARLSQEGDCPPVGNHHAGMQRQPATLLQRRPQRRTEQKQAHLLVGGRRLRLDYDFATIRDQVAGDALEHDQHPVGRRLPERRLGAGGFEPVGHRTAADPQIGFDLEDRHRGQLRQFDARAEVKAVDGVVVKGGWVLRRYGGRPHCPRRSYANAGRLGMPNSESHADARATLRPFPHARQAELGARPAARLRRGRRHNRPPGRRGIRLGSAAGAGPAPSAYAGTSRRPQRRPAAASAGRLSTGRRCRLPHQRSTGAAQCRRPVADRQRAGARGRSRS